MFAHDGAILHRRLPLGHPTIDVGPNPLRGNAAPRKSRPFSAPSNGTIGAPPVGGRRRLRRGNTDAVTVAELTGEIPIVHDGQLSTPVANGGMRLW